MNNILWALTVTNSIRIGHCQHDIENASGGLRPTFYIFNIFIKYRSNTMYGEVNKNVHRLG